MRAAHLLLAALALAATVAATPAGKADALFDDEYELYEEAYDDEPWLDEFDDEIDAADVYDDFDDDEYDFADDADAAAGDCTLDAAGIPTFATPPCDLRLAGADALLAPAALPLDGVYAVAGCHAGRPLYVRQNEGGGASAPGPRVLWYSAEFHDWDVTIGAEPNPDDIALYGGRGGRESRPQNVPAGTWRLAADLQSAPAAGGAGAAAAAGAADGYTPSPVTIACASGEAPAPPTAGAGASASSTKPAPLLTDAEMGAQYASIYARARRARAASRGATLAALPLGVGLFAAAGALVGLPLAVSRSRRRRRARAGGRPAANPTAGTAPGVAGLFGVKRDHAH